MGWCISCCRMRRCFQVAINAASSACAPKQQQQRSGEGSPVAKGKAGYALNTSQRRKLTNSSLATSKMLVGGAAGSAQRGAMVGLVWRATVTMQCEMHAAHCRSAVTCRPCSSRLRCSWPSWAGPASCCSSMGCPSCCYAPPSSRWAGGQGPILFDTASTVLAAAPLCGSACHSTAMHRSSSKPVDLPSLPSRPSHPGNGPGGGAKAALPRFTTHLQHPEALCVGRCYQRRHGCCDVRAAGCLVCKRFASRWAAQPLSCGALTAALLVTAGEPSAPLPLFAAPSTPALVQRS